jgi:hypothetical protein
VVWRFGLGDLSEPDGLVIGLGDLGEPDGMAVWRLAILALGGDRARGRGLFDFWNDPVHLDLFGFV